MIQRSAEMKAWVLANSNIVSESFLDHIYCAVNGVSNVCPTGSTKKVIRFNEGFAGCGPASKCECTRSNIAANVSKTKQSATDEQKQATNDLRAATMVEKYGVAYNSQRAEVKPLLSAPKIANTAHDKLTNYTWLNEEYNNKKRTLVDIAAELNVYYSTVGEYCKKFGFPIRQVTNYSRHEREIGDYIQSLGLSCEYNSWDILDNAELDIVVPAKNFAVEVDGLYWHSHHPSGAVENRTRHINKTTNATAKGIELLHVTDFEWDNKKTIIQAMIRSKLGLNDRVHARKCDVKSVSRSTEKEFLDKNHLQGFVPSEYAAGLYFEERLVMVLTVGKSRYSDLANYEILRVCGENGITVVGGLSKLLSVLHKNYPDEKFVTYCDLAKSSGNSYKQVGMKHEKTTEPGYFWTDGHVVISRYKCQKTQLAKWLSSFNPNKTERENMFDAGYRVFWDCGNSVFVTNE